MSEEEVQEEEKPEVPPDLSDVEIIQLMQEAKEFKDKYLLLLAESENARKRLQKEKTEMTRFALGNMLAEFLAPLDQFESALGHAGKMSDEVKNWAMGFEMILTLFKDIFSHHGVTSFHAKGERFDPNLHEAVEVEETDEVEDGIILEEFVRGYKCGERVLRPAKVKVSKKKEENYESEKE